jgi:hypothetical protein
MIESVGAQSPREAIRDYVDTLPTVPSTPNLSGITGTALAVADSHIISLIRINTLEDRVEQLEREMMEIRSRL